MAQDLIPVAAVNVPSAAYQPAYVIAAGGGLSPYASNERAHGWMTFAAKITDATYSLSTVEMMQSGASLRTGLARMLIQQGPFTLTALADAGLNSGSGNIGAALSGGGMLAFDIGKWTRVDKTFLIGTVRIYKLGFEAVAPVFGIGIGKAF
jgi:hypothetical protein